MGNLHLHTPACPSYRHTPNLGKITPTTPLTPLPPCRQSRQSDKACGGWPETPLATPSRPPQSVQKPLPCPPRLHVSTQPPLPASPLSPSPGSKIARRRRSEDQLHRAVDVYQVLGIHLSARSQGQSPGPRARGVLRRQLLQRSQHPSGRRAARAPSAGASGPPHPPTACRCGATSRQLSPWSDGRP